MDEDVTYSSDKTESLQNDSKWVEIKQMLRQFMVILPLVLLSAIAGFPMNQVQDQIVYVELGGNISNNANESRFCVATNGSSKESQDEVQSQATLFKLYMSVGSCIAGIISMPFWCGWSDTIGRQVGMLAAFTGMFIKTGCFLLVTLFDSVPIWILIMGDIILGLLGKGGAMIFAGSASYIADVTSPGQRTLLMLVLEFFYLCSSAVGYVGSGILIKSTGFISVLLTMMGCHALGLLYTILVFEKASRPQAMKESNQKSSVIKYIMSSWNTFTRKRQERPYVRRLLFALISMLFIYYCGFLGSFNVMNLFALGYPLCWGSALVGINNALMAASSGVFPLLFGVIFFKMGPTPWLILIGIIGGGIGCVIMGLSTMTWMMLLGVAVFAIRALVSGTARSILADIVDNDEIGAAMAGYGIVAILADLISSIVFNAIYSTTLSYCKGCVFFVGAACFGAASIFLGVFVSMRIFAAKSLAEWKNLQEETSS